MYIKENIGKYTIFVTFDNPCGAALPQLSSTDLRVYKGEENITHLIFPSFSLQNGVVRGAIANLVWAYHYCNDRTIYSTERWNALHHVG